MIETMADFENIIRDNLDCPICKEIPTGRIFICEQGHSVCLRCRKRIKSCPMCKGKLTKIRNICAEKIAAHISRNCEYREYGCTTQLMNHVVTTHEETCKFRPYRCDLPGCILYGTPGCNDVEIAPVETNEHMKKMHNLSGVISDKILMQFDLTKQEIRMGSFEDSQTFCQFFKCYGCMFLAIVTIDKPNNCAYFVLCTSIDVLKKYTEFTQDSFTAQVSIKNSKYSAVWQGSVTDSKKSLIGVFKSGTCLSLGFKNMVALSKDKDDQTQSLDVVFSIIKTETSS